MYSLTKSAKNNYYNHAINFDNRKEMALKRATDFVTVWLQENNKKCNELIFDKNLISYEKEYFKYTIRVIEQYLKRAHCFELVCNRNMIEISYIKTSQSPLDLLPGDFTIILKPSWQ